MGAQDLRGAALQLLPRVAPPNHMAAKEILQQYVKAIKREALQKAVEGRVQEEAAAQKAVERHRAKAASASEQVEELRAALKKAEEESAKQAATLNKAEEEVTKAAAATKKALQEAKEETEEANFEKKEKTHPA